MGLSLKPHILDAKVSHRRVVPVENGFTYGIHYLAFPLQQKAALARNWLFGINRKGLMSFHDADHGYRAGDKTSESWLRDLLSSEGLGGIIDGEIVLVTLPRVLGFVFNPVSFFLCYDASQNLRSVVCEVNNTFGETHTYLCAKPDLGVITPDDVITGSKLFHVSPFMQRDGDYRFRFVMNDKQFGAWIDYYRDDVLQLTTALTGKLLPYDKSGLLRLFWRYPLATLRVVFLIHWQAVKLVSKRVKYVPKPVQLDIRQSVMNGAREGQ